MKRKLFAVLWILLIALMPNIGKAESMDVPAEYSFETILANGNKIENEFVFFGGYPKIEEDGIAVYYSMQDYLYGTKENAIWLPERKDLPLKEYVEQENILNGERTGFYTLILKSGKSDYPIGGMYLLAEEKNQGKMLLKKEPSPARELYDRNYEEEQAQSVSAYRLLGNPWAYDGRKVKIEAYLGSEGVLYINKEEYNTGKLLQIEYLNGKDILELLEEKEAPKVWEEAFQEYKKYGIENPYALSVGAIGSKARLYMENMFYMYSSRRDEAGQKYEKINYEYQCRKIRIHEKDFEAVKEKIGEYEAQGIKFDWE